MKRTERTDWLILALNVAAGRWIQKAAANEQGDTVEGAARGLDCAARALDVPTATVKRWLRDGFGNVPFTQVCRLSDLSDVPVSALARCVGPRHRPGARKAA